MIVDSYALYGHDFALEGYFDFFENTFAYMDYFFLQLQDNSEFDSAIASLFQILSSIEKIHEYLYQRNEFIRPYLEEEIPILFEHPTIPLQLFKLANKISYTHFPQKKFFIKKIDNILMYYHY